MRSFISLRAVRLTPSLASSTVPTFIYSKNYNLKKKYFNNYIKYTFLTATIFPVMESLAL